MSYNKELIAQRIKNERERMGLTLDQFSELMDFSPGYVSATERGGNQVSSKFLYKLNELFGISIESILLNDTEGLEQEYIKTNSMKTNHVNIMKYMNKVNELEINFMSNLLVDYQILNQSKDIVLEDMLKSFDIDIDEEDEDKDKDDKDKDDKDKDIITYVKDIDIYEEFTFEDQKHKGIL